MKSHLQRLAIYIGGAAGPFSGQALTSVLENVSATFAIPVDAASLGITAYLAPFAVMMLFSSRLVQGRRLDRVVLAGYAVIVAAAVVLAFVGVWWWFLALYALMGVANAFTTPMLQSILKAIVPAGELGQALGTYAAAQSLGMLSAPLVSGAMADFADWRYTFLVIAACTVFVLVVGVPEVPREASEKPAGAGSVPVARTVANLAACFAIGFGLVGIGAIIALEAIRRFEVTPSGAGIVVACGGAAAFVLARYAGSLVDRFGAKAVAVVALVASAGMVLLMPHAPHVAVLTGLWAVATVGTQTLQTAVNVDVLSNPATVTLISTVQAFRFIGVAAAPLVVLPLYLGHGAWAYALSAAVLAAAAALQLAFGQRKLPGRLR
ncbi:MFS transporter [Corynebacterium incognita]|uniref:MFS transporter n=1 Tax=Corynebacterium incognita TaxID=2754725 RepID=A0A7G7CN54_9CORY|nr:MFS transporter [Corynebacterium incognita]QNE89020.1 MFS transporter [Corynebacterium incognita]